MIGAVRACCSRREVITTAVGAATAALWRAARPGLSLAAPAKEASGLKLLFSGPPDVSDTWGKLHFGVTPVRRVGECQPPGFNLTGCFPLGDGTWEVFGQQMSEVRRGREPYDRITSWKLLRATTRDGARFAGRETVFQPPAAAWTDHCAMAPIHQPWLGITNR